MARFEYDIPTVVDTIAQFEAQIMEMRNAKSKIAPELETLKTAWTSEGSKKTIVDIEQFLNNDFESFLSIFDDSKARLEEVKHNLMQIDGIE